MGRPDWLPQQLQDVHILAPGSQHDQVSKFTQFSKTIHREGNTFLFRPTVLVERVDRVECQNEEEALKDFIAFLNNFGSKILLLGLDEDTMAVLRKKIKKFKKEASLYLYTWWNRILKYKRFFLE